MVLAAGTGHRDGTAGNVRLSEKSSGRSAKSFTQKILSEQGNLPKRASARPSERVSKLRFDPLVQLCVQGRFLNGRN